MKCVDDRRCFFLSYSLPDTRLQLADFSLSVIDAFNACLKEAPLLSQTLALKGFVRSSIEDYQRVLDYQQSARELGYSTLA